MHDNPAPQVTKTSHGHYCVSGTWLVHELANPNTIIDIDLKLSSVNFNVDDTWDLSQINALDHIGAQIIWRSWDKQRPSHLIISPLHDSIFSRLEQVSRLPIKGPAKSRYNRIMRLGNLVLGFASHIQAFTILLGQFMLDFVHLLRHPSQGPWREISANIYRTGFQALGITALVGLLIGVVLSYLSSQQLLAYGGDLFLVNILGMSIIRELGPMLAAILIAGRSGSAITAQLGVMRVTEELDAMRVMGIAQGFRLIMPKVIALAIAMPLIVIWTDVMALIGGMISAKISLNMSPEYFLYKLPDAVPLSNYWIGLGKGFVFGILIALVASHYGLRIKPNTESLGQGTTSSVVISITVVIIADALFAIVFSKIGF